MAEGPPYILSVPAIRSGPDELERWEPLVSAVSAQSALDIRLSIERSQEEVMERLRSRRADAVILDSVATYALIQEIPAVPIGLAGRADGERPFKQRFAVIVPARSLAFTPAQIDGQDITVVDVLVYPAMLALTTLLFADLELMEPHFHFVDTETSILKGTSYGWNSVGVVSEELLRSPVYEDYVRNVRVIARSDVIPSWFLLVRSDTRRNDHESIRKVLQESSRAEDFEFSIYPLNASDFVSERETELLNRAVQSWRSHRAVTD
jgi:ABC-type phosphate/phosphonate transport system substrate-binding protein